MKIIPKLSSNTLLICSTAYASMSECCKFTFIRKNFIFANIYAFDTLWIQHFQETFVCLEFTSENVLYREFKSLRTQNCEIKNTQR